MKIFKNIVGLTVLFVIVLSISNTRLYCGIVINEVLSWNIGCLVDEDGDYSDWIELYNSSDESIDLKGWSLTDNESVLSWKFPHITIPPSSFLIVFCSGKNKLGSVMIHTDFKIKSEGEGIYLFDTNGILADYFPPVDLAADVSSGRFPDGGTKTSIFFTPTPWASNSTNNQMNTIEFSHKPGFYKSNFLLNIKKVFASDDIYYTLDGSEPTINSRTYTEEIPIKSKKGVNNIFSTIRTNPEDAPSSYRWQAPMNEIFKATVVRAATFKNGVRTSPVLSSTFIIHPDANKRYSFPVVSITTDSINLFGFKEGIYVPGKIYTDNPSWTSYWGTGNYHQSGDEWERPAHIEFFETDGVQKINQNIGIRIHGSGGRALPEKSLRLYARSEYGKSTFDYQIFPKRNKTDFKRLILRNSGQDFLWTLFADALIQDLSRNIGIEVMDHRASIVFINGEYWGIHGFRERYDEYYLEDYCGLSAEDIEIYETVIMRTPSLNSHFDEMYKIIENNDLSIDENYEKVSEYIDIYNTINYFVHKIYFAVYDWPGNNVQIWRPKIPGGKWRWLTIDNDDGLMYPEINTILHATADDSEDWRNPPWSTFIFRNLMKNKQFEDLFFATLDLRMKTVFSTENVLKKIDEYEAFYQKEINEHIARWNYPINIEYWKANIERMRDFARRRADLMVKHKEEYFKSLSIDDNNVSVIEAELYPNPCNGGVFSISIPNLPELSYTLIITDVLGQCIHQEEIINNSENSIYNISLTNPNPGVYFINLKGKRNIIKSKLVIY